ncbi:unnamed protein product [Diatraea saccharalis]|uniref:Uncharacterized protein n=1 Tax=Diatraea saccharalis TaxID=40085 RepID=A0A9N9QWU8_9NEOP|nr:unnamed protein product [Diatraea saccharalis]
MAFVFKFLVPFALASVVLAGKAPGGYSYNRFSGPVSGRIIEVKVPAAENIAAQQHADYGYDHQTGKIHPDTAKYAHLKTVDYVAKPDYQYAYGVEDPHTGNLQNHKEFRDGDVATVHKKAGGQAQKPVHYGYPKQQQEEDDSREY